MISRLFDPRFCVALLLFCSGSLCLADDPLATVSTQRKTPLVLAVERVKTSVVNIHSEKTSYEGNALFPGNKGKKVNGMGTGIIVDERGYIVTNNHVVEGVESLRVTTIDGSTHSARVIRTDKKHDLAIIKIDSSRQLKVMKFGTSSDVLLGETVFAIGNAFGYEHTVTSGIVSHLSRDVEVNEHQSYERLIQTDASINPGNSGGPLLNLDGEVIAINVAIRAGAQRIGFAIPIDDARKIIADLISAELMNNTWHGLVANDVKSGRTRQFVVNQTMANSPAKKAGFQNGDVILKAGSTTIVDRADFERALIGRKSGETMQVTVKRGDSEETLAMVIAQAPRHHVARRSTSAPIVRANNSRPPVTTRSWQVLGMQLATLGVNQTVQAEGTRYRGGLKVVSVRRGSPAEMNGIQAGDILVGLHLWETVTHENVSFVLDHPELNKFNPLKFYILRGQETLYGHMQLASKPR